MNKKYICIYYTNINYIYSINIYIYVCTRNILYTYYIYTIYIVYTHTLDRVYIYTCIFLYIYMYIHLLVYIQYIYILMCVFLSWLNAKWVFRSMLHLNMPRSQAVGWPRQALVAFAQVVKRAKLTHVAFSKSEPIIIVGDDRGGVTCYKNGNPWLP